MKQRAERIWESPLAGRWYSADPEALRRELAALAPQPAPEPVPGVRGVIVPHAGYAYSGKVAMAAYARLDPGAYDRAVVIGPSHAVAMPNRLSAPEATHIRTPLGACEVDLPFLQRLHATPFVIHEPRAHAREHSDQIQLPLLQAVFGTRPLRVVPLVCGWFEPAVARAFGETLRSLLDSRTLLVISTDFTHYGPSFDYVPFTENVSERLRDLDHRVFACITAGDAPGFRQILQATGATVCGENPLALLIAVAAPAATIREVAYDQSGRMTGDWENSVSYLSALANW